MPGQDGLDGMDGMNGTDVCSYVLTFLMISLHEVTVTLMYIIWLFSLVVTLYRVIEVYLVLLAPRG